MSLGPNLQVNRPRTPKKLKRFKYIPFYNIFCAIILARRRIAPVNRGYSNLKTVACWEVGLSNARRTHQATLPATPFFKQRGCVALGKHRKMGKEMRATRESETRSTGQSLCKEIEKTTDPELLALILAKFVVDTR